MRQVRIDNRRQPAARAHTMRHPAPHQSKIKLRRESHTGVHMELTGLNLQRNTVRYLCPMCSAQGLPPIEIAAGVVSQYFPHKGYGFIDNGGPRIFFHISDLGSAFKPYVGQAVICRVEQNARGLIGKQIKPQ